MPPFPKPDFNYAYLADQNRGRVPRVHEVFVSDHRLLWAEPETR
jgi:hypothetical protein